MSQSMREKIARAICHADEQNGGAPWEHVESLGKHALSSYFDRADAVLDALMEPTEAMEEAADEPIHDELKRQEAFSVERFGKPAFASAPFSRNCWQAMIRAAKEGK